MEYYFFGIVIFWLFVLTLAFTLIIRYFRNLSKGVEKGNLIKVLESVINKEENFSKSLKRVEKEILEFEQKARSHLQKKGLIRYNPFGDVGGNHSFSLAILDGEDNGFIITGLHTRERTRIYLKGVKKGKSNLELSDEEKKALNMALKNKFF